MLIFKTDQTAWYIYWNLFIFVKETYIKSWSYTLSLPRHIHILHNKHASFSLTPPQQLERILLILFCLYVLFCLFMCLFVFFVLLIFLGPPKLLMCATNQNLSWLEICVMLKFGPSVNSYKIALQKSGLSLYLFQSKNNQVYVYSVAMGLIPKSQCIACSQINSSSLQLHCKNKEKFILIFKINVRPR